jgi:hypothetical protein
MQSPIYCALKKIAQNTPDFETFKENLVDRLLKRESGSNPDAINLYSYIKYPMQEINICDIADSDNLRDRAGMQIRNIEKGVQGGHGVAIGRQIESPIAVKFNDEGTYNIIDGFHRPIQAIMNGDKTMLAFIVGGDKGITLKEFYDQAKAEL